MDEVTSKVEKSVKPKKHGKKEWIKDQLNAMGIHVNGDDPWDIQVHKDDFYDRVFQDGSLGLGESYTDGWWDCERIDILIDKLVRANLNETANIPIAIKIKVLLTKLVNYQSKKHAKVVAYKHYNLGNQLFSLMLDKQMNYSCGYWKNAFNLDEAQTAKLDLICRKLKLKPGQKVLDVGCGWGGFAKFASLNYGVSVVGITISEQQFDYAKEYCKGLPIKIRLQDYRDLNEKYDHIVSIGMFEHVGYLNYRVFMEIMHRNLMDDGLFLLHTIGGKKSDTIGEPWLTKYIFPNAMTPSIAQIGSAIEGLFNMEDWHNFGHYYDDTLMAWHHNFNQHWDTLKSNYDNYFFRMWNYYLLSCAGSFRARHMQLWQIVLSKKGIPGGYESIR